MCKHDVISGASSMRISFAYGLHLFLRSPALCNFLRSRFLRYSGILFTSLLNFNRPNSSPRLDFLFSFLTNTDKEGSSLIAERSETLIWSAFCCLFVCTALQVRNCVALDLKFWWWNWYATGIRSALNSWAISLVFDVIYYVQSNEAIRSDTTWRNGRKAKIWIKKPCSVMFLMFSWVLNWMGLR